MISARRDRRPELMDDPALDQTAHRAALDGLRRGNRFCGTSKLLWSAIREAVPAIAARPIRILDVGCGGGDVVCDLWKLAATEGIDLEIAGCDRSSIALSYARERASHCGAPLTVISADVLIDPLPVDYDVVLCSKFLHHFDEPDAVTLLRNMRQAARHLVLVDDHLRSWLGYWLTYLGARLLSRSRVVHVDGPLSVRAAFTLDEIRELAHRAGLEGARIRKHWPEHFVLTWSRLA